MPTWIKIKNRFIDLDDFSLIELNTIEVTTQHYQVEIKNFFGKIVQPRKDQIVEKVYDIVGFVAECDGDNGLIIADNLGKEEGDSVMIQIQNRLRI